MRHFCGIHSSIVRRLGSIFIIIIYISIPNKNLDLNSKKKKKKINKKRLITIERAEKKRSSIKRNEYNEMKGNLRSSKCAQYKVFLSSHNKGIAWNSNHCKTLVQNNKICMYKGIKVSFQVSTENVVKAKHKRWEWYSKRHQTCTDMKVQVTIHVSIYLMAT